MKISVTYFQNLKGFKHDFYMQDCPNIALLDKRNEITRQRYSKRHHYQGKASSKHAYAM